MLLSTLITQMATSRHGGASRATDDEPKANDNHEQPIISRPALSLRDDGVIAVRRGGKGFLVGRPGHVSSVIIRRLLSGHPVSGQILMKEYRLPMSTAMSAIARLAKLGIVTLEAGGPGLMRY